MMKDNQIEDSQIKPVKVADIMTGTAVSVEMDDALAEVKGIFDHTHFHHLLVVESGKLCGVVSDRDLLKALSPNIGTISETMKDAATLNKKVHQVMTRKPITLHVDSSIMDAINVFNEHVISCIPVIDDEDHPMGILSWRDIFRSLASS